MSAIPYSVRRSSRARRARIRVGSDGVEVVVPARFPSAAVEPLVERKRPWIERTLLRMERSRQELSPARLEDGGELPYLGERLRLRVRVEPGRRRAHVVRLGDELLVALAEAGREALLGTLERWYRGRARVEVAARLDAAAERAGVRYASLQIRGQRARWASCSAGGAMSFNWRLLLAPAEILEYVVEHELAHLEVHDHSPRFWSLVASRSPGWREHERWLRDHGHALRL